MKRSLFALTNNNRWGYNTEIVGDLARAICSCFHDCGQCQANRPLWRKQGGCQFVDRHARNFYRIKGAS